MTEIRYYPLIDCDSEGSEKVPMFAVLDEKQIMDQSRMWLEEMVPNYFRLCNRPGINSNAAAIRCPRCGKPLARMSETINETTRALYVCDACVK